MSPDSHLPHIRGRDFQTAQIMPIVGVISFCLTIGYTIYQWRKDAKKNTPES